MTEVKVKEIIWATSHGVKIESESLLHTRPLLVSGMFWQKILSWKGLTRIIESYSISHRET